MTTQSAPEYIKPAVDGSDQVARAALMPHNQMDGLNTCCAVSLHLGGERYGSADLASGLPELSLRQYD